MTLAEILKRPQTELEQRGLVHTPREIAQQADSWLGTLARVRASEPGLSSALRRAGVGTSRAPHVVLLGAGTSDFVGRSVANLLRTRFRCPTEVIPTTDFVTHERFLLVPELPYLTISFSRSGSSPESVLALEQALNRAPGTPQLVVTCDAGGKMATDYAQHPSALTLLLDDAVNDRSLAMTSAYSNMVMAGLSLAHWQDFQSLEEIVRSCADAWRRLLVIADPLAEQLAARAFSKVYYLGSGPLNAVARESVLKLTELTAGRVSSGSESFLGVRHGPLSALDDKTLLVALISSDPRVRRYELDLLTEIRQKRLAEVIVVVAAEPEKALQKLADHTLELELSSAVSDDYLAPVMVLFGQLLGFYSSIAQGLRPDAPSPNGVINRLVSGIEIYP